MFSETDVETSMQLGINLLCLDGFIEASHLHHLHRLKALGYDGVEVPVLRGGRSIMPG